MLNLIYFSNYSGNTHRFLTSLKWEDGEIYRIPIKSEELDETVTAAQGPYILITPSYGVSSQGRVPPQVKNFLNNEHNRENIKGVVGAGNINFGWEYGIAGDILSAKLQVPMLYKFELAGTTMDMDKVTQIFTSISEYFTMQEIRS